MSEPVQRRSFAEIRASLPAGELISEARQDGTLILRRPDYSVGTVPGALYITHPGNAVMMRTLRPARPVEATK